MQVMRPNPASHTTTDHYNTKTDHYSTTTDHYSSITDHYSNTTDHYSTTTDHYSTTALQQTTTALQQATRTLQQAADHRDLLRPGTDRRYQRNIDKYLSKYMRGAEARLPPAGIIFENLPNGGGW